MRSAVLFAGMAACLGSQAIYATSFVVWNTRIKVFAQHRFSRKGSPSPGIRTAGGRSREPQVQLGARMGW